MFAVVSLRFLKVASVSLLAMLLLSLGLGTFVHPRAAEASADAETAQFLQLINTYRAQHGLGSLGYDQKLQEAANWMTQDFVTRCVDPHRGDFSADASCVGTASHIDSLGRNADPRIKAFGYLPSGTWSDGENIFGGSPDYAGGASQAFTWWQNSPGHNANMLKPEFAAIGISRTCDANGCAWVTDFGSQVTQACTICGSGGGSAATNPGNVKAGPARSTTAYITWIQQSLNQVAGAGLNVDGKFGPLTEAAVRAFQGSHGLKVDGIVGPDTEAALLAAGAPQLPVNRTGPAYIKWVQQSLNQIAGAGLAVDGIVGPKTQAAVKAFQSSHGLTVDGIVGPNTEAALIAAGAPAPPR